MYIFNTCKQNLPNHNCIFCLFVHFLVASFCHSLICITCIDLWCGCRGWAKNGTEGWLLKHDFANVIFREDVGFLHFYPILHCMHSNGCWWPSHKDYDKVVCHWRERTVQILPAKTHSWPDECGCRDLYQWEDRGRQAAIDNFTQHRHEMHNTTAKEVAKDLHQDHWACTWTFLFSSVSWSFFLLTGQLVGSCEKGSLAWWRGQRDWLDSWASI